MAISLGDIKKKKLKIPTIEVNSSEKINIKKAPSSKTNNQTISLADIKSGKSKIEPIKQSTKTHAQQYNLDGSKKIAPTVSITNNNIVNKGATNILNNTLQQDIKNKTFEAATRQNKQQIKLAGDSTLTKSQKQELREKTLEEKEKINENLPQMVSADSVKNQGDDLVKKLSKKTGYSEQEVTDFINDYNNGRWDSTKPKYRNASYKFKEAGTEVYLAAKEYDKYKPTLNKQLSPLENASQSSVNALIETGKGIVDFSEGVLDAGVQLGSSKYNPMMWITTGQTPWSKDQSKLDNYQEIAKEIVSKDASQNFIDNELGYGKTLSNGRTIQETLDEGALIKSDNLGGQVFRNIGAQLPGLMTGSETGSLASMGISSFGSGVEQAYNQGATRGEATGYGLLNSGIEVATEKMFSGVGGILGKGELDDAIINGINKNIKNELTQKLTSFGIKSLGEGAEEFFGDLLQPMAQKLTYASEEELMKLYKDQNYLEDFVSGVLSAAIMQGSTMPINNQNQIQIKNQVKEIVNKDNANQVFNDILDSNKNLSEWEVANIVNNALKETNQKPVDFSKNVVQNETIQEVTSNTPQISQEIGQNRELSNETINNSQNTQYSQIENNKKKIAPVIIKYEKSDNQKINNYRQSAIREGLYDNEKTRSLMNVSEKLIQEKGYNIVFDRTITNEKGQPVNAQIKPLDNGEIEIRVNPNSERAGEFLLIHEVSHAIKTQDMIDYVNKFASKNKTFAESVKSLEQQYGKDLTSEEVFADVCGQLFGNQEFIDSLTMENTPQSRNIIKKVYESIKKLLNNFTTEGRYKSFVQNLETKWREAYKNTSIEQAISNLNNETKYAQKTLKDGTQYIETEKNLFTKDDGTAMSQREIYNSLIGKKITFNDGITATIKQWLPNNKNMYNELFKRYPNYKNVNDIKGVNKNINENIVELLENSNNVSPNEPDYMNRHKDNKINSFDTRKVSFFDGKNAYDLDFSIAKMQDGNYVAYAKKNLSANNELLNKIKKEAPTSKSRGVLPYADNISQNSNNVKSDISSTKYSMQESTNNTQELDNSSFSYDNQGRTLTKEQQEYFKDSKVRDEQGNLKVLYHGTPYNFTKFSYDKLGTNGTLLGKGFYLTDDINVAKAYANKGENGKVMELYADIKKPLKWGETSISKQQFQKFVEAINQATDGRLFADYSGEFSEKGSKQYTSTLNDILMDYEYGGDDIDLVSGILNTTGMPWDKGYKILNDTTGYDGIIVTTDVYDSGEGNVYIPFQSNQIKNVDNTNPTLNEDIRYSQENQTWQEHLEENYKATGTRTYFNEITDSNKKTLAPIHKETKKKISAPIVRENNTINEKINKKEETIKVSQMSDKEIKKISNTIAEQINKDGGFELKQRRWIETATKSEVLNNAISIEDLDASKTHYEPTSNKKTLEKANKQLDTLGYEEAIKYIEQKMNDERVSAKDIALAERLIQEAIKKGDMTTAQDLIMNTAILGTEYGQTIQALSIIQRLTPEGQLKMLDKIVSREKSRGNKTFEGVEITPQMVEKILKAYNNDGTYDQDDLNKRVEEVKQEIAGQLKTTFGEKADAWRYLSMLGNPKTHIRNIVSNVAMKGTIAYKNAIARTIETAIPIKNRTKTWKKSSEVVKNFAKEQAEELKGVISGETKYSEKASIEAKKTIFKTKFLEKLYQGNSTLLDLEDWLFSKSAFESTFREYLTAQGIRTEQDIQNNPKIITEAQNYSIEQAQIATFRQYSKIASEINRLERKYKGFGLAIKAVMPFKKTPVNIAKAGVSYSPLGFIKNLTYDMAQVIKGNMEASQYIDNLSQGLSGTSLTLLGYVLAKAGILKGDDDNDKESKYDSALGNKAYTIKLGENYYSLSWLSPVGMPLFVGANAYKELEENKEIDMNVVTDMLTSTINPISEMSLVSSLTDAIKSFSTNGTASIESSIENAIKSYVGQYFPTLLSQIASLTDAKKRSTSASSNSKWKYGEEVLNSIKYKIPGLRQTLPTYTDSWGKPQKQAENIFVRAWETFIAPYTRYEDKKTNLDKEIMEVYYKSGNVDVIPGTPNSYITYNKERYNMSNKEYETFKKTYGTTSNNYIKAIIKNDRYKSATYEDKAKIIDKVYDYALTNAQLEYFNKHNIEIDSNYTNQSEAKKLETFKEYNYSYSDIAEIIISNYYKYKRD